MDSFQSLQGTAKNMGESNVPTLDDILKSIWANKAQIALQAGMGALTGPLSLPIQIAGGFAGAGTGKMLDNWDANRPINEDLATTSVLGGFAPYLANKLVGVPKVDEVPQYHGSYKKILHPEAGKGITGLTGKAAFYTSPQKVVSDDYGDVINTYRTRNLKTATMDDVAKANKIPRATQDKLKFLATEDQMTFPVNGVSKPTGKKVVDESRYFRDLLEELRNNSNLPNTAEGKFMARELSNKNVQDAGFNSIGKRQSFSNHDELIHYKPETTLIHEDIYNDLLNAKDKVQTLINSLNATRKSDKT